MAWLASFLPGATKWVLLRSLVSKAMQMSAMQMQLHVA